jgi:hypothetical protein
MHGFRISAGILCILLVHGCTAKDKAPFAAAWDGEEPEDSGSADQYSDAGGYTITIHDTGIYGRREPNVSDGAVELEAGAGEGGVGEAGGGSGAGGGVTGTCDVFDPDKIYLFGVLQQGDGNDSTAPIDDPQKACSLIPSHDERKGMIRPSDGALIYIEWNDRKMRVFRADEFVWDDSSDRWQRPENPLDNDPLVPDDCGEGNAVQDYLIDAQTSEIFYRCSTDTPYKDESGTPVEPEEARIISFGYEGYRLAVSTMASPDPVVIDASGNETRVQGLAFSIPLAVRARQDGFWVALAGENTQASLWRISFSGETSKEGDYAALPEGYSAYDNSSRLDAEGRLYQMGGASDSTDDAVVMRPLAPANASVAYTEADAPAWAQDYESTPPRFYVMLHGSAIFTGP